MNSLQYTKGDTNSRIVAGGMANSMEAYRQLIFKGKNATVTSLMDRRVRIMQPDKAKTIEEGEMRITN